MRPQLWAFPLLVGLCLPTSLHAEDRDTPSSELWIFGGMQGGLSDISGTSGSEVPKGGWNLGFKVLLSKYTPDWVLDVGAGWFHDQQSASASNASIQIVTNGGFVDLSPRYRLSPHWQIGPSIPILFGPDVGFSEDTNSSGVSVFGGLRVEYEFSPTSVIGRIGLQAVTDVTIASRQVSWLQLDLQIGFPTEGKAAPAPVPTPEPTPEPVVNLPIPPTDTPTESTVFPAKVLAPAEVQITLNDVYFHFDTDSAKLHSPALRRLKKLAYYLLKHNDAWSKMRVDGHTDRRGSAAHNTKLSKRRAESVARQMVQNGVEKSKLKATGYGPTRPVDPARNHAAYAKNRRVEVVLEGVTDSARLAKDINHLSDD